MLMILTYSRRDADDVNYNSFYRCCDKCRTETAEIFQDSGDYCIEYNRS